jgi:hypothetical protein
MNSQKVFIELFELHDLFHGSVCHELLVLNLDGHQLLVFALLMLPLKDGILIF